MGESKMIINGMQVFREQAGLIPSVDIQSTNDSDCVLLTFNSAINPENEGGYLRIKLKSDFLIIQGINVHGYVFEEQVIHCSKFNTLGE
jgi:hypothetical protein